MRRLGTVLGTVIVIGLLRAPDVLAGGGMGLPLPDKTVGPTLNVTVVMEGPREPSEPTYRRFSMNVDKSHRSHAAMFTGGLTYSFGCMQTGFPDLQASTEQRFLGLVSTWAPNEVRDALIGPFGNPDQAVIIAIDDISCTPIGDQEYLYFTGRLKFAP